MFVDFFIDRPIFAGVISIVISLAGAVCIILLPIAQFPEITPPTVKVQATYTGANAEVVEKTVTTPIEEQITRGGRHDVHVLHQFRRRHQQYHGHL